MTAAASIEDYADYWLATISKTRELERHEWPRFLDEMFQLGFATRGDKDAFRAAFDATKRQKATPRPGIQAIKLVESAALDVREKGKTVAAALRQILTALGEPVVTLSAN